MSLKTINIEGNTIDPTLHGAGRPLSDGDAEDASGTNYILIQSKGPLSSDQKAELRSSGVNLQTCVSEQTYLCEYKPNDLVGLRDKDYVLYANVYQPEIKINAGLKDSGPTAAEAGTSAEPEVQYVSILFHDGVDASSTDIRAKIAEVAHVDVATVGGTSRKASVKLESKYLQDLATIDEIRTIEKVRKRVLYNNIARGIMNAEVIINSTPYQGDGQLVAVADTGFDKGNTTGDVHPAFTSRVARLYPRGKADAADPEYLDDFGNHHGGHGTHVCGSVLGDGDAPTVGGRIQGTAPRAKLVMQAIADENGNLILPNDLGELFNEPYSKDGARIHTNSWGLPFQTQQIQYDDSAEDIDTYIWEHKDMTICFAAGNDGRDPGGDGVIDARQIGSEAVAKNCITVGASENLRTNETLIYANFDGTGNKFPSDPIKNDLIANDPEGMAAFSSRGPSKEGRIKPDVTAPGTMILSTRARSLSLQVASSADPNWAFMSGTSMATPLVAGCLAVLRETLEKNGVQSPPAALLKALLINGAVDMQGQYQKKDVGPSPNSINGWGRVNLANSVILPNATGDSPLSGLGSGGPLSEGDEERFTIQVPTKLPPPPKTPGPNDQVPLGIVPNGDNQPSGIRFKITMVWSDPPGPLLQNNLNLIVKAANGEERHGNMGTDTGFDTRNNVEQVSWPNIPPGPVEFTVRCASTTRDDQSQDYSFAWRLSQM